MRHDFWVDDETWESAEQIDISGRYEVETDSQVQISTFLQFEGQLPRRFSEIFQEALQHPNRLLMHLDALDHEILRLEIIGGPSSFTKRMGIEQEDFVAFNEVSYKIFCWRALNRQFVDPRGVTKIFQAPIGKNIQRAQALSDLVNGLEKVFILLLKGLMKLEEIRTLDIPVCKVRLCHQGIRIGQDGLKALDHCIGFLLCRCMCAHNGQDRIPSITSLRNSTFPVPFSHGQDPL